VPAQKKHKKEKATLLSIVVQQNKVMKKVPGRRHLDKEVGLIKGS